MSFTRWDINYQKLWILNIKWEEIILLLLIGCEDVFDNNVKLNDTNVDYKIQIFACDIETSDDEDDPNINNDEE